jgi:2-dehydro-3-deoxygluconokinase
MTSSVKTYDIVTLGETMLRFTPPALRRLEQTLEFELHVGGSESNTAVGLARLGMKVAWLSRLTDNGLGHIISRTLFGHGVDSSHVVWTPEDRVGLYFLEEGKAPRGSQVIYDRKDSAIAKMQPNELPVTVFQKDSAKLFHTTGITLAISQNARATATKAVELAKQAGWLVSFDVNYRRKLWSPEEAKDGCEGITRQADILFIPLRDAKTMYGLSENSSPESVLEFLVNRFPKAVIAMTMSVKGALAFADGKTYQQDAFKAEEVGRLGGGDSFSAGFLYGYLSNGDIGGALRWGAAVAALKYSITGDFPLIEKHEAEALVNQKMSTGISR